MTDADPALEIGATIWPRGRDAPSPPGPFTLVAPIDFSAQQRYSGGDVPVGDRLARRFSDRQRAVSGVRPNAWAGRIAPTRTDSGAATPWSPATLTAVDGDRSTIPNNDTRVADARAASQSVSFPFVLVWVGAR
jgi:hypothetical protein